VVVVVVAGRLVVGKWAAVEGRADEHADSSMATLAKSAALRPFIVWPPHADAGHLPS
jgi:hypothetical protein